MEYRIKKAVITGASGGVGQALVKKLLSDGIEILIFQRKASERKDYLPCNDKVKIKFYSLDELKDYTPAEKDYDVFFHLGWANTDRSFRDDIKMQEANLSYSCDAVELAKRMGCHTFIGAGSQAEYGHVSVPMRGDMVCNPDTAYGIMKLCACHSTRFLCEKYGIRHMWMRILSGYGIYDNINSILISNIIKSFRNEELEFSKGEQIWDFLHMDDIADAMIAVAKKGRAGHIYPIGSGKSRPLMEYIKILCNELGEDYSKGMGKIQYSKKQVMYLAADNSEIEKDTGWKPKISFEQGIKEVIEFYRNWYSEQ